MNPHGEVVTENTNGIITEINEKFSNIDVLINNAGLWIQEEQYAYRRQ